MPQGADHWRVITEASLEVGPALFFSLLIITLSFLPIFTLQAQEGRLFAPLAFTKTYAMAASRRARGDPNASLMGFWIRGRIPHENDNPSTASLARRSISPAIDFTLGNPRLILIARALGFCNDGLAAPRLGGEFMPMMDEGDLLYMPTALPGLSAGKRPSCCSRRIV
jgi:Cu(I)/Ag(I) efflux system membrane protein CusA/SilA